MKTQPPTGIGKAYYDGSRHRRESEFLCFPFVSVAFLFREYYERSNVETQTTAHRRTASTTIRVQTLPQHAQARLCTGAELLRLPSTEARRMSASIRTRQGGDPTGGSSRPHRRVRTHGEKGGPGIERSCSIRRQLAGDSRYMKVGERRNGGRRPRFLAAMGSRFRRGT